MRWISIIAFTSLGAGVGRAPLSVEEHDRFEVAGAFFVRIWTRRPRT
jgi:hypothetical protein